jgi:hypothetical protein
MRTPITSVRISLPKLSTARAHSLDEQPRKFVKQIATRRRQMIDGHDPENRRAPTNRYILKLPQGRP